MIDKFWCVFMPHSGSFRVKLTRIYEVLHLIHTKKQYPAVILLYLMLHLFYTVHHV